MNNKIVSLIAENCYVRPSSLLRPTDNGKSIARMPAGECAFETWARRDPCYSRTAPLNLSFKDLFSPEETLRSE